MMDRRRFLKFAAMFGLSRSLRNYAQTATVLEPWRPGNLDIHHLAYGRGNSTFVLAPDGSTLLIDAGTTDDPLAVSCAQKPDASVRPGEWIASYIQRHMRAAGRDSLDYALITHIHPDHVGDLGPENPLSASGDYHLTGITDVAARVRIDKLIDRGFPNYDKPSPPDAPFARNYLAYVAARHRRGESTEQVKVGSAAQIRLLHQPHQYPGFAVRNLAANGEVWTGVEENTRKCFPNASDLSRADYPTENMCSVAIRLSYGKFDYFTGGDLTADTEETDQSWRDIETPVARAAGPVEVAVADHHAYFDAVGPESVRALQPEVFIIPSWYVAHPVILPLRRMLSRRLYPADRDIFATCVMDQNRSVNNQFISKLKSVEGNIVVRVAQGGQQFRVLVTSNDDNSDRVKLDCGPYQSH